MSANGEDSPSSGESYAGSFAVERFRVREGANEQKTVYVKLGNERSKPILDLAELPSYEGLFSATSDTAEYLQPELYRDFERIFKELQNANITIEGEFSCVSRLLNLPNSDASLKATQGFLYYNSEEDVNTYGSVTSRALTEIPLSAIQVHIERRRTDRLGRTLNRLTLRRETLYLVRGLTEFVPRERTIHREIHTFRAPRAYIDEALMCDAYNYPKVEHLSLTMETSRGRELATQVERMEGSICEKCLAKTDALYYEDCHEEDCSVSGVLHYYGPTARLVSNDILFSRFGTVKTRALEIWPRAYVSILKATKLVARLYKNSRRDFVSEILRIARCGPSLFLQVANVSRKIRSFFSDENTCYMLAPGPRGQLLQSTPLDVDLNIEVVSTQIEGQYVDRVNLSNFSLTQTENGKYHMLPCDEPYAGPKELGQVKFGAVEDRMS